MRITLSKCALLACAFLMTIASMSGAAPTTITIQGTLQNDGGALSGTRAFQVKFFDAGSGGSQLGSTLTGATTVEASGRFSFVVVLPAAALDVNTVYYELGIDSAATPDATVDAADIFPDRIQVTSVPFARNVPPRTYDAVVSAAGDGDFTTVNAALTAGAKTIFIRNGIYTMTNSILFNVPGISLIGESMDGVIFDAQLQNRFIQISGGVRNSPGTISINQNSTAVLGTGTAFLANANPGDLIELPYESGNMFEIATVVADDGLTLKYPYRGKELSGNLYRVNAPARNIRLENITIRNYRGDFQAAFYLIGLMDSTVTNCRAENCEPNGYRVYVSRNNTLMDNVAEHGEVGMIIDASYNNRLIGNRAFNNSEFGILIENSEFNTLQGNTAYNNQWAGIAVRTSSQYNTLTGNVARNNVLDGIFIHDAAHRNIVSANESGSNGRDGIRLGSNSDYNSVTANITSSNTGYGIHVFEAANQFNILSSNNNWNNGTGAILNNGTGTVLTGNVP